MSKQQKKRIKAARRGHFPYKLNNKWYVIYSSEFDADIYGPFTSKREATNTAYHNSIQAALKITVTVEVS